MSDNKQDLQTQNHDALDVALLPTQSGQVVLPSHMVADVVPFSRLLALSYDARWLLGRVDWQGQALPVICFEVMSGNKAPAPNVNAAFAVVRCLDEAPFSFYAVMIQSEVETLTINESDLVEQKKENTSECIMDLVMLKDRLTIIPNIEHMEAQIAEHME